ncbi:MAG: peptide-methionine (S)-S-oxide reductase MsrA [Candidatus Roizmanbacteria bacterium]|nr:peptide-methionine (S)-S-oxide reductase MsrA [Candidatus Roizmanbacteria bacterium]
MKNETVVFGGGCFWCTEAVFQKLKGVKSVISGYAGGNIDNPNYYEVSEGKTQHAEVIKIEYDQQIISFKDLLSVFFAVHNPTSLNRQGNDVGTHYRSVIMYTNKEQKKLSEDAIKKINNSHEFDNPVATEIIPLNKFFTAESYHQNYYQKNMDQPYCVYVIVPKLEKLQEKFKNLLA